MSFVVEQIQNNRDNIVFNNNKFRETYSLKSGEIIWRCLGRTCGATIRTDGGKKNVIATNDKHSGPHPVTMRSLCSPGTSPLARSFNRSSRTAISPAPVMDASNASTPSVAPAQISATVNPPVAVSSRGSSTPHAVATKHASVTPHVAVAPHVAVTPHVPVTSHVAAASMDAAILPAVSSNIAVTPHVPVTPQAARTPNVPVTSHAVAAALDAVVLPADASHVSLSFPASAAITSPRTVCSPVTASPHAFITSPSLIIQPSPTDMSSSASPTTLTSLLAENHELRLHISQLQHQVKVILDHSIESDTRLMSFTDEVFADPTSSKRTAQGGTTPTSVDISVQCAMPVKCKDEECAEYRVLVQSLRTTVEVLEAEIQCLKTKACDYTHRKEDEDYTDWTTYKTKSVPLELKNRYDVLSSDDRVTEMPFKINDIRKKGGHQKKKCLPKNTLPQKKNNFKSHALHTSTTGKTEISFRSVIIKGDSHGRHLAGMIQDLVNPKTSVVGVVKPGASLLNVTSSHSPTPNSCSILIAGTNDLGGGRQNNICRHLEQCVSSRLGSTKLMVSTLPHRYDLPEHHPINNNINLVNRDIKALVDKYEGVGLVDFNRIGRRFFTNHGLHLRMAGKRLFSRLILESLVRMDLDNNVAGLSEMSSSMSQPSPSMPLSLPFDTFADAVKQTHTSPPRTPPDNRQTDEYLKNQSGNCFLGTPLYSKGPN